MRERFYSAGPDALSDYELLEMVLFRAIARRDVKPLAKSLIGKFGSFAETIAASPQRLAEVAGLGDAAITGGGNLTARFVIHAASMRLGGRTTAESLRGSTRRSLEIANQRGLRSIAFPAVGTGIAHFPMDECARIMIDEVVSHARSGTSLEEVRFVLFGADGEAAFRREADRLLRAEKTREEDRGEKRQRHE